jgi:P27 family predicted phage terminase small subunit
MRKPSQPIPLKVLQGRSFGRDSGGRPIPQPPAFNRGAPEAPQWLDAEARAEWERIAPELERLDLLKPEDHGAFAAYCTAWSRFVAAVKTYHAEGLTVTMPPSGRVVINPAVHTAQAASRELLRYAQQFGLTPAAEVALARPAKLDVDVDDPFGGTS